MVVVHVRCSALSLSLYVGAARNILRVQYAKGWQVQDVHAFPMPFMAFLKQYASLDIPLWT